MSRWAKGVWRFLTDVPIRICNSKCPICDDSLSSRTIVTYKCCSGNTCSTCFNGWIKASLDKENIHAVSFKCPLMNCGSELSASFITKKGSLSTWRAVEEHLTRLEIISSPDVFMCPYCSAGGYLEMEKLDISCIVRVTLYFIWCTTYSSLHIEYYILYCAGDGNFGLCCWWFYQLFLFGSCITSLDPDETMTTLNNMGEKITCPHCAGRWKLGSSRAEDQDSTQWLARHSKPCPGCSAPIQRSGGCKHMTCKQCRYQFCWLCGSIWTGHNAFGKCPSSPGNPTTSTDMDSVNDLSTRQGLEAGLRYLLTRWLSMFLLRFVIRPIMVTYFSDLLWFEESRIIAICLLIPFMWFNRHEFQDL